MSESERALGDGRHCLWCICEGYHVQVYFIVIITLYYL